MRASISYAGLLSLVSIALGAERHRQVVYGIKASQCGGLARTGARGA